MDNIVESTKNVKVDKNTEKKTRIKKFTKKQQDTIKKYLKENHSGKTYTVSQYTQLISDISVMFDINIDHFTDYINIFKKTPDVSTGASTNSDADTNSDTGTSTNADINTSNSTNADISTDIITDTISDANVNNNDIKNNEQTQNDQTQNDQTQND